jgi:aspartate aminotransferase
MLKRLSSNAQHLHQRYLQANLKESWYQTDSAFYFMVDFTKTPVFTAFRQKHPKVADLGPLLCEELLEKYGLVMVPGADFGLPNSARISLVLEPEKFAQAAHLLVQFLSGEL